MKKNFVHIASSLYKFLYRNNVLHCFYVLLFIISGTFLVSSCAEKLPENDLESLKLKGNVKEIEEEFYYGSYSFDKIVLNKSLYVRYFTFDTSKRFTEYIHTNVFLRQTNNNQYIDSIDFILLDSLNISKDTVLMNDSIYNWAESLASKKEKDFIEPDFIRKDYRYLNDSIYLISNLDEESNLLSYEDCRKRNNKLTTVRSYTKTDQLLSKTDYVYDYKGRLTGKTKYFEKISYQTKYDYNWGRKHETDSYSSKYHIYSFNKSGLLKKQKEYIGNTHISTLLYKYDKIGNPIFLQEKDKITGDVKESTFSYKYDAQNNWIERVEKRYDGNIFVTHRRIDYY